MDGPGMDGPGMDDPTMDGDVIASGRSIPISDPNDMTPAIEPGSPSPLGDRIERHADEADAVRRASGRPHDGGGARPPRTRREHPAHIAQAVEHSLGKGEVTGSSPVMGTTSTGMTEPILKALNPENV